MFNEAIIIPVIMAVIEILKGVGLPKKFGALAALVLGIVIGIFFLDQPQIKLRIFQGVIYGLSASGLYSGAKNAIEEVRMRRK
ncbi:holin [Lutispora saccharofermentans]|uniref:Holin n=1 Tax=Lutispora saccharofermentans TaxID=3024236 RepID=A0ABT1NGE8_9FIRM|nr:holin [Lutispora saccharofermentans]MCQ1530308.1 holin [Lutispora saccharofermentans]